MFSSIVLIIGILLGWLVKEFQPQLVHLVTWHFPRTLQYLDNVRLWLHRQWRIYCAPNKKVFFSWAVYLTLNAMVFAFCTVPLAVAFIYMPLTHDFTQHPTWTVRIGIFMGYLVAWSTYLTMRVVAKARYDDVRGLKWVKAKLDEE